MVSRVEHSSCRSHANWNVWDFVPPNVETSSRTEVAEATVYIQILSDERLAIANQLFFWGQLDIRTGHAVSSTWSLDTRINLLVIVNLDKGPNIPLNVVPPQVRSNFFTAVSEVVRSCLRGNSKFLIVIFALVEDLNKCTIDIPVPLRHAPIDEHDFLSR